jgi:hypothetical protein
MCQDCLGSNDLFGEIACFSAHNLSLAQARQGLPPQHRRQYHLQRRRLPDRLALACLEDADG